MGKTLVIVESPAKCKKIQSYLGENYIVKSSYGHLSNLRGKNLGIEINNNYKLIYDVIKNDKLNDLKKSMKFCDKVILASDEDREGEAIAYHIANLLKINLKDKNRITFNEITKSAIKKAIENPRQINLNLVNAQQARQGLDYMVGFNLSPLLCKTIGGKLSAGRVQSIAVKLIVEKEEEINNFIELKYFNIKGFFNKNIIGILDKKFLNKNDVVLFLENCINSSFKIENIIKKKITKNPPPPFITTTIQMEVGRKFNINSKTIMNYLQKLYEDGKITYHRTDSVTLSNDSKNQIKDYILNNYGENYLKIRNFKNKSKNSQEAHEAIRPTNINLTNLNNDNNLINKIYRLIWLRTVASQMSSCILNGMDIIININNRDEKFHAKTEKMIFDGFKKIYESFKDINNENENENENVITDLKDKIEINEILINDKIECVEKYKNTPPRYSEATLIKKMEELNIGRPSTYANIMSIIQDKQYVEKNNINGIKKNYEIIVLNKNKINFSEKNILIGSEKNKLIPTEMGKITTEYLNKYFNNIMDYNFTSDIENYLDDIVNNKNNYFNVMNNFYLSIKDKLILCNNTKNNDKIFNVNKKNIGLFNNKNMYVYKARYGPVIQIGEDNDKDKYYISIDNLDITYEEALSKCDFPKNIGKYNDIDIYIKKGKYGFYLYYNKKNFKINSNYNEFLTLEQAIECINNNNNNIIKKIGKYTIKNGDYGYYIQFGKNIKSIPKNKNIDELNENDLKIIFETKTKKFKKFKK